MEEIRGTEALEQEILGDARRRADRILRKAGDDAKALEAQTDQRIKEAVDALAQEYQSRQKAAEQDMRSRLPLEKTRLEIEYRDRMLRKTLQDALAAVDPRLFGGWCVRRLRREAGLVRSSMAKVLVRGLDASTVQELRALFSDVPSVSVEESASMKARGLSVEPADGSYHISITEDELVAWLLDEKRGELGAALFGSTL
jgi:vacuolar-type H+-ATPase subunit H